MKRAALVFVVCSISGCYGDEVAFTTTDRVERDLRRQADERAKAVGRLLSHKDRFGAESLTESDIRTLLETTSTTTEEPSKEEIGNCRKHYYRKQGLALTGYSLSGIGGGLAIAGAIYTNDSTATPAELSNRKMGFAIAAGSLTAIGAVFSAFGIREQILYDEVHCTTIKKPK
jgi:hypothetical protein